MHTEEPPQIDGVLCIHANEMVRPFLMFEEIKQSDGSLVPGDAYWSIVEFAVESPPSEIYGHHHVVDIYASKCERWRFYDTMIMLSPNRQVLKSFGPSPYHYMMTYQRVERLSPSRT